MAQTGLVLSHSSFQVPKVASYSRHCVPRQYSIYLLEKYILINVYARLIRLEKIQAPGLGPVLSKRVISTLKWAWIFRRRMSTQVTRILICRISYFGSRVQRWLPADPTNCLKTTKCRNDGLTHFHFNKYYVSNFLLVVTCDCWYSKKVTKITRSAWPISLNLPGTNEPYRGIFEETF